MDRDYLVRRFRSERRLAGRAKSAAAVEAHLQLAAHYQAQLVAMGKPEPRRPWFERLWRWVGNRDAFD